MSQDNQPLDHALADIALKYDLTIGVSALPLPGTPGEPVALSAEAAFPSASTIKLYIMAALLQAVHDGRHDLDDEITMRAGDQVGGSGVLKSLTEGRTWNLRDIAMLMMIVSDNTATNLLIDLLGVEAINGYMRAHGWNDTYLLGKLALGLGGGRTSHTSPRDLTDCMSRLWQEQFLPERETRVARHILLQQHYTDTLGRHIGFDAYATENPVRIASKSGSITGVRNEVGVIARGDQGYVVAVMTKDGKDPRFWANNAGNLAIMEANALLFERFLQ